LFIINKIKGKFRTFKIYCLHKGIDLINLKYNLNINKLPLDNSDIGSNAWLAGFVEADRCFHISLSGKYSINNLKGKTRLRCIFTIKKRILDKISGECCTPFM